MEENKVIKSNEFSTMAVTVEIFRWKWFILIFTVITTAIATYIAFQMPNWYSSSLNLVPPKTSGSAIESALGNVNNILKDFGMSKLGGKGGDGYSYLVVLNSRTVKDSIIKKYGLAKEYEMENEKLSSVRLAFEGNLEISMENEGNFYITIYDKDPNRAVDMVNDYFDLTNKISQNLFKTESRVNREYLEKRLQSTEDALYRVSDSLQKFSEAKKVISPMEQAKSITTAISELKAEQIKQDIVYQMLINKYGANDPTTLMQKTTIDELNKKIDEAENRPGFAGNFSINKSAEVGIKYLKLYAQVETFTKVKSFLLPMLEEAKLNENRETYSLFIIDKAIPSDKKARPKRSVIVAGSALGSFVFAIFLVILIYNFRIFLKRIKEFKENN